MKNNLQKRIVTFLKKGKDLEWIAIQLDIDKNTVRAHKAHLTMGTYDNSTDSKESKKRYVSKEALIELLRFGIPDEILLATYKSLKPSILHAYKAHITMGTYDQKKNH